MQIFLHQHSTTKLIGMCAVLLSLVCGCASPTGITTIQRGAQPTPPQALEVTHKHLRRYLNDYDSMKDFSVVRGPEAMSARNLAGNYEEAWLLCVEYNAKNLYGAYTGIKEHPIAMRFNMSNELEIIAPTNWVNYRERC